MLDYPPFDLPLAKKISAELSKIDTAWLRWLSFLFPILQRIQFYGAMEYQAPNTSGFSYQSADNTGIFVLDPTGAFAAGGLIMPQSPGFNQRVWSFSCTKAVTAFTLTPGTGHSVANAPTSLSAGDSFSFIYRLANSTWYRTT